MFFATSKRVLPFPICFILQFLLLAIIGSFPYVLSAPVEERQPVTVVTPLGTVVGFSQYGIDTFQGIPYAKPPVGQLRLTKPEPVTERFGELQATNIPRACPQIKAQGGRPSLSSLGDMISMFDKTTSESSTQQTGMPTDSKDGEDCLTIKIQRPASFSGKLPVVFWIYGGGFNTGATNVYDASNLITASVKSKQPIIWVAVNYRLNAFGFLAGQQVTREGITNLGLLDQRLGLEWVADNIAAFGGDPDQVTIWGESAGAGSAFSQMTLYDGNNVYKGRPLFRAAVMNSGGMVPAERTDAKKSEDIYQAILKITGCNNVPIDKQIECLRSVDYDTYVNAASDIINKPEYSELALPYMPRPDGTTLSDSAEVLIAQGKYTKIPMITGDQEDEGTLFSQTQRNLVTTADIVSYLHTRYLQTSPISSVEKLVSFYPADPSKGSPFRTGSANNIYPQYKRIAALQGDFSFTLRRRNFLILANRIAPLVPSWSYIATYYHELPVLGTTHASDMVKIYGIKTLYPPSSVSSPPSVGHDFAQSSIYHYYLNFFHNLDPNVGLGSLLENDAGSVLLWPEWGVGNGLLEFGRFQNSIWRDDFRREAGEFMMSNTLRV